MSRTFALQRRGSGPFTESASARLSWPWWADGFRRQPLQILGLLSGGTTAASGPRRTWPSPPEATPRQSSSHRSTKAPSRYGRRPFRSAAPHMKSRSLKLFRDSYPLPVGRVTPRRAVLLPQGPHRVPGSDVLFDVMTQQLGAPGQFATPM